MNNEQANIVTIWAFVFVAIGLYPPWVCSYAATPSPSSTPGTNQVVLNCVRADQSAEYGPLWDPPRSPWSATHPDLTRLALQWLMLTVLFGVWWFRMRTVPGASAAAQEPRGGSHA
jgi:hypothetical protein